MKKILLAFLATTFIIVTMHAQHCASATTNVTPITFAQPGLQPYPENLPCTVVGTAVIDTVYFQNFTTVSTFHVDSLKIDSIENLPPGLCWVTNSPRNTFAGGQAGVILLSGTPTGPPGQYKLRIIVNAYLTGLTLNNLDAEQATGLRYWVRTKCPAASCTALDTTYPYPSYKPYAACPGSPPTATISPAGAVNLCSGSSLVLTASSGAGYTYKWSTGQTTNPITVTTGGAYTVTVYHATDSAVSSPTTVTVVNLPSAAVNPAGPVTICQGDTSTLSAVTAGLTYAWSTTATTQSIRVTTAGTYHLTVTDNHNCTAASPGITVSVNPLPTASITRNGFTLTANAGSGYTYQWYKDGTLLSGQTAQTLSVTANGSYTVVVTSAGCHAQSAATSVTNVGINDINANVAIRLYPNPSEGLLTLETEGRTGDKYEIYDEVGRSVQQKTITADKMLIDMSSQQSGIYYMTVRHDAVNETVRFSVIK